MEEKEIENEEIDTDRKIITFNPEQKKQMQK